MQDMSQTAWFFMCNKLCEADQARKNNMDRLTLRAAALAVTAVVVDMSSEGKTLSFKSSVQPTVKRIATPGDFVDACKSEQSGSFVPPSGLFDEHTNPDLVKVLFHLVGGTWMTTLDAGNTWSSMRSMLWPDLGAVLWCSTTIPDSDAIECSGYELMLYLWSIASRPCFLVSLLQITCFVGAKA